MLVVYWRLNSSATPAVCPFLPQHFIPLFMPEKAVVKIYMVRACAPTVLSLKQLYTGGDHLFCKFVVVHNFVTNADKVL